MSTSKYSERHPLEGIYIPLQPDLNHFSEQKKITWEQTFKEERERLGHIPISFFGGLPPPPKNSKTTVFWDFHNVADFNLNLFVKTVQFLNSNGVESRILSFVGRGTRTHANVLIVCSLPTIKALVKEVVLVFDKKKKERGKGHIIREWLVNNPGKTTVFVDDSPDNFKNVRKALDGDILSRCKLVHFVGADDAKEEVTPEDAVRVDQWDNLHEVVCGYVLGEDGYDDGKKTVVVGSGDE